MEVGYDFLLDFIRECLKKDERTIIGLVGCPGSGKSTLCERIVRDVFCDDFVVVPMDGYHLSNKILKKKGLRERKGYHTTFDSLGNYNRT